ncbi:MAG TPA: NADH-quinone oxidoreductase subunit J [Chthoniobacteraceae bacterium]|nr:NADH-quinone oxidoreductase subunit J [Chthoniobacteraceae bacterium]
MDSVFFWFFSILMLGFAVMVVVQRNPVASALSLVVSFLGLAALFVLLDAYFIAVIQVLVYAGAVMVLFLFIIMLLDLRAEERRKWNPIAIVGGGVVTLGFAGLLVKVLHRFPEGSHPFPPLPADANQLDDVRRVGMMLFNNYNLPLQVVGGLVLVATLGIVILSKRELK